VAGSSPYEKVILISTPHPAFIHGLADFRIDFRAAIETPGTMTQLPHSEHAQYRLPSKAAVTRKQPDRSSDVSNCTRDFSDLALLH
jgi:hypothetical protein